tara:strand:- start:117 stop:734 length:618 start_codon:yes stop_codon:yes gene_type:complete
MTVPDNSKTITDNQEELATVTSEMLSRLVFDTLLDNSNLLLRHDKSDTKSSAERFTETMDLMNELVTKAAKMAMVNRTHLSPMPIYADTICADPNADQSGRQYELRYRIIEKFADKNTGADQILSFDEAKQEYGIEFINRYWGEFGEHCPRIVKASKDREMWFSVVRYPVASLDYKEGLENTSNTVSSKSSDDVLNEISRSISPR